VVHFAHAWLFGYATLVIFLLKYYKSYWLAFGCEFKEDFADFTPEFHDDLTKDSFVGNH
jgi:hypothetical protein